MYRDLPLQQQQKPMKDEGRRESEEVGPNMGEEIPYLYNLPSGSSVFSYF